MRRSNTFNSWNNTTLYNIYLEVYRDIDSSPRLLVGEGTAVAVYSYCCTEVYSSIKYSISIGTLYMYFFYCFLWGGGLFLFYFIFYYYIIIFFSLFFLPFFFSYLFLTLFLTHRCESPTKTETCGCYSWRKPLPARRDTSTAPLSTARTPSNARRYCCTIPCCKCKTSGDGRHGGEGTTRTAVHFFFFFRIRPKYIGSSFICARSIKDV